MKLLYLENHDQSDEGSEEEEEDQGSSSENDEDSARSEEEAPSEAQRKSDDEAESVASGVSDDEGQVEKDDASEEESENSDDERPGNRDVSMESDPEVDRSPEQERSPDRGDSPEPDDSPERDLKKVKRVKVIQEDDDSDDSLDAVGRRASASSSSGSDQEMAASDDEPVKGPDREDKEDDEEEDEEQEQERDQDDEDEREEEEREERDDRKESDDEDKEDEKDEEKAVEKDDSDSDENEKDVKQAVDADDVLADLNLDDDEDEDEEKEGAVGGEERDEDQPEEIPITRIEVEIPKIPNELGNDIHFVKLPNFLSVDTHPYDPSWYEDEIDEDEILDEEGRHRLKLKVESTIRWRTVVDENGISERESNARIVKWSDGSMSLHLGSEIFDIHKQSLMAGDNNHLFIRQGTGLQGQAVFKTKLTFRPHSTDSFTHRKMTLSLAERSHKTQKIRVLPNVGKDPEAHRSEMIKKEEDKLKASIRRENKMRRVREKAPFRGPTASYLEPDAYDDDDDDAGVSLSAIKKAYKKGGAGYNDIYTDSDDESDLDIEKKKSLPERKRVAKVVESDDEDE